MGSIHSEDSQDVTATIEQLSREEDDRFIDMLNEEMTHESESEKETTVEDVHFQSVAFPLYKYEWREEARSEERLAQIVTPTPSQNLNPFNYESTPVNEYCQ